MPKRLLAALSAALLTLSLAACDRDGLNISATQAAGEDFQKNTHQSTTSELRYAYETEDGIYIQLKGAYVYYIDKSTKSVTILCGKPECEHNDDTCNARLAARSLCFYNGKLYYFNGDKLIENGQAVDYGDRIYSANPDGTDHKAVQKLEFTPSGDTNAFADKEPIIHRGVTYFPYCGVLYALPLGGDIEDAEKIWGDEIEADGSHMGNLNRLTYKLWGDGNHVYFMVNLEQSDGTYKDTLFDYDTISKETTQVWEVPGADEVGQWETTGVSVSQWYVLGGYIYFYLSGGDFWRSDLGNGKTEKLADTHEKTEYGSAVFSDDYLCLMNDGPEETGSSAAIGNPSDYIGGDTIYVYGLDGSFIKELSLKSLYDQFDTLESCKLAFCSGSDIYFVADASVQTWSGGVGTMIRNRFLCCVDIDTGEIAQIYNW